MTYLFPHFNMSPKFKVEDLPDLTGRVYLVTGGNTGMYVILYYGESNSFPSRS